MSSTPIKRDLSPDTVSQSSKRVREISSCPAIPSASYSSYNQASLKSSDESETVSTVKMDKGKGKMNMVYLPELPQEIWARIFEIYYEDRTKEWHSTSVMKGGLNPLLISRDHARYALPVLYRHPYVGYSAIDQFVIALKRPSRYTDTAKRDYIKHLTIRPSPIIPKSEFASYYSEKPVQTLVGDDRDKKIPRVPYTVHTSFVTLMGLLPEIIAFTLKDTLILHQADARMLFRGLELITPKKARLEIRMWDLYDIPNGQELICATRMGVPSVSSSRPAASTEQPTWVYRTPQREWLTALYDGTELDLPAEWTESDYPDDFAAPQVQHVFQHPLANNLQPTTSQLILSSHGNGTVSFGSWSWDPFSNLNQYDMPSNFDLLGEPDMSDGNNLFDFFNSAGDGTFDTDDNSHGTSTTPKGEDSVQLRPNNDSSPAREPSASYQPSSSTFPHPSVAGPSSSVAPPAASSDLLITDPGSHLLGPNLSPLNSSSLTTHRGVTRPSLIRLRSSDKEALLALRTTQSSSSHAPTLPPPVSNRPRAVQNRPEVIDYIVGRGGVHLAPIAGPENHALAHHIRDMLLDLTTNRWTPKLRALSVVTHDPMASLVVCAPRLDFWPQIAVPHVRVHLPPGCNTLSLFKGSKELARDRARRRAHHFGLVQQNPHGLINPEQDSEVYQEVGGDGAGGGLIHQNVRLFEIEINTLVTDKDDVWVQSGDQLPPQLCRIMAGKHDWRDVSYGPNSGTYTPRHSEFPSPESPRTYRSDSPALSFVSLASDSGYEGFDGDAQDADGSGAGDTYDKAKAEEQARRKML